MKSRRTLPPPPPSHLISILGPSYLVPNHKHSSPVVVSNPVLVMVHFQCLCVLSLSGLACWVLGYQRRPPLAWYLHRSRLMARIQPDRDQEGNVLISVSGCGEIGNGTFSMCRTIPPTLKSHLLACVPICLHIANLVLNLYILSMAYTSGHAIGLI